MKKNLVNAALVVTLAGCASTPEGAPVAVAEVSVGNAFYTTGQASRGEGFFRDNCVSCHASSEFNGSSFERRWRNRSVGDIYEFILYSMPDDNPGGLPAQTYVDIVAYMLQLNDFPVGDSELPTSMDTLLQMNMWPDPAGDGDR